MMPKVINNISDLHEGNGHATAIRDGRSPVLERLLRKLKKVRRTPAGWQSYCPCHEAEGQHSPSLSVGIGDGGRILLHCHAGCSFDDVVSALEMRASDFAPGNTARSNPLKKETKGGLAERLKRLSAFEGRKNGTGENEKVKRLSDLEEDELLLGVVNRANNRMGEDASRPTPFPLDGFPKALKRFVEESAMSLPCPPDYIGLAVLVVASSFVGAGRPIRVKRGWEERAAIYGVIVGPTGSRKSPALELGMAPARKRDRQLAAEYKIAKQKYAIRMREAKANRDEPPPVARQHVTTDTTVEALADVLGGNPCGLLLYRDEATGWVASLNQYKGGKGSDRQFWLSAWSSQDYTVNRKGKEPLRITRPFISVIGNIPPDMLGELADRRGREDGFIDRILFAYPDPVQVKWTDAAPNHELENSYVDACLRIGKLPDATLAFDRLAQAEFALWFDEHNRSKDGPAGSWAKMDGYCARLASIIHHLRYAYGDAQFPTVVDVVSVRAAIALIDYFKNHVRRALGRMNTGREGRVFARLLAFVVNAPDYRVRPRSLIAAQIAANADEAKALLQRLACAGLGEMVEGRRKDEVIFQGREDLEEITGRFEEPESS